MPLLLAIIGAAIVIAAIRNTQGQLGSLLASDGPAFLPWAGAILAVGFIGFVPELRGLSRAFLALLILVIILQTRGGFFGQFAQAIKNPAPAQTSPYVSPSKLGPLPIQIQGGTSGAGGILGSVAGKVAGAATGSLFGGGSQ